MNTSKRDRRQFLKGSALAWAATWATPYTFTADAADSDKPRSKNDRFGIGAIGMNNRGTFITKASLAHGDVVAICDVDSQVAQKAKEGFGGKAGLYEDYRKMLERPDVDVVMIGSPDHWHAAMAIDACRAGKDVFCEKPLTLTVNEGNSIIKAVKETGAVVQVGTWRRSEKNCRLACEMVRQGRLGKLKRVTVTLGTNPIGGPFITQEPPSHLNWDMWLGQTPLVPYCPERCHRLFRWWLAYSGGQMTDWGAHHIDIAQWGMNRDGSGPIEVDGRGTFHEIENGYDVPTPFECRMVYDDGVELIVEDKAHSRWSRTKPETAKRSGILFEGEKGRIFANERNVDGKPAEELKDDPLPREEYKIYAHDNLSRPLRDGSQNPTAAHMDNFFDCIKTRNQPISDVAGQHRTATVCHLGTISMRLGRKLKWDPAKEQCVGDDEANSMLSREPRKGFELPS